MVELPAVSWHGVLIGELAHLRPDLQRDQPVRGNRRHEGQADAELLEFDRHLVVLLRDRDGKLAAHQEARRLAADRGQVGLGQDVDQFVLGERVDQPVEIGAQVQRIGRSDGRGDGSCCWR